MKFLIRIGVLVCVASFALSATAQQLELYVQLVRGTDSPRPRDPNAQEIGPLVAQKLRPVFKWRYYFVNQQQKIALQIGRVSRVDLRNGRAVEIHWLSDDRVEVSLF